MTMQFPPLRPVNPLEAAISALRAAGHRIDEAPAWAPGLPAGLYHIDGGPELTSAQVVSIALSRGLLRLP